MQLNILYLQVQNHKIFQKLNIFVLCRLDVFESWLTNSLKNIILYPMYNKKKYLDFLKVFVLSLPLPLGKTGESKDIKIIKKYFAVNLYFKYLNFISLLMSKRKGSG